MKKLLLIACFLASFIGYGQTGYKSTRNNGVNQTTEDYVINSPGNTPSNSVTTARFKDSTYVQWLFANAYFANLPNTVNNGNPVNFLHTDGSGRMLSSSISWLYPDTNTVFPTKYYLGLNYYNKAQSDMRYLQSFIVDSVMVVNAVGVLTWAYILNKSYHNLVDTPNLGVYYLNSNPNNYISSYTETDPLFNTKFAAKSTNDLTEGTNKYWTAALSNGALTSSAINSALAYTPYNGTTNPNNFLVSANLAGYLLKNDTVSSNYTTQYRLDSIKTSLNAAISLKLNSSAFTASAINGLYGYTPYSSLNPANYITNAALSPYALTSSLSSYLQKSDSNIYQTKYRTDTARTNLYAAINTKLTIPTGLTTQYLNGVGTPTTFKRVEPYSGTTNASGVYAVTFSTTYSVAPNIQANIIGGSNKMTQLTTVTTTGFSIYVQLRADVLGLLPTYSNVSGQAIDVLISEK